MLARLAAMGEDIGVVTASFFQGVGQDGQVAEAAFVVDGLGQLVDGSSIPSEPDSTNKNRATRTVEYVSEQPALSYMFNLIGRLRCIFTRLGVPVR